MDKSIKEILLDMRIQLRKFQEAYYQTKRFQRKEIVCDESELDNEEEANQHHDKQYPETSSVYLKRQNFDKHQKKDQNLENVNFEVSTAYTLEDQHIKEDIDYDFDYVSGVNDGREGSWDEQQRGGNDKEKIEKFTEFNRKRKEKRKKDRKRRYKAIKEKRKKDRKRLCKVTKREKIDRLRLRGWRNKIKRLQKMACTRTKMNRKREEKRKKDRKRYYKTIKKKGKKDRKRCYKATKKKKIERLRLNGRKNKIKGSYKFTKQSQLEEPIEYITRYI